MGADELADNAAGQPEIRNNGVGASEIADQSIDGGEIIDGGLSTKDVVRWTGNFSWAPLAAGGQVQISWVQVSGAEIAGDLLLMSPAAAWPRDLVYAANGTGLETEFKVQACNRHASQKVAGGTCVLNYADLRLLGWIHRSSWASASWVPSGAIGRASSGWALWSSTDRSWR